jgi:hypothetical protein
MVIGDSMTSQALTTGLVASKLACTYLYDQFWTYEYIFQSNMQSVLDTYRFHTPDAIIVDQKCVKTYNCIFVEHVQTFPLVIITW